ncbi:MAG: hypothetical protein V4445_07585 [Pseudomonadota bacterium]
MQIKSHHTALSDRDSIHYTPNISLCIFRDNHRVLSQSRQA